MAKKSIVQKKELPLEWHIPENIPVRYATNLVIQRLENEYLISFFEVLPPILLGTPEEIGEKLGTLNSVRANCVAKIIVSANKMPEFVSVMQRNLEKAITQSAPEGKTE